MDSPPETPGPPLPPPTIHNIPPAAERIAKAIGRVGWVSFWGHLIATAVLVTLLVLALVSRSLEDGDRVVWVSLSIFMAIASCLTLIAGVWLAFRMTQCARYVALPYMKPTPGPQDVQRRVLVTLVVSLTGLGIGLLGTGMSAVSLLAKTLTHPQGAALYSPESTLRVLDVMIILINSGLAIAHFWGLAAYGWLYQRFWIRLE